MGLVFLIVIQFHIGFYDFPAVLLGTLFMQRDFSPSIFGVNTLNTVFMLGLVSHGFWDS